MNFIKDLLPVLKDPRYIKVDGAPFFIVYRPQELPNINNTLNLWREYAKSEGIDRLNIYCALTFGNQDYQQFGFDGGIEYPPLNLESICNINESLTFNSRFTGNVVPFETVADNFISRVYAGSQIFKTVLPSWDNTARCGERSFIILNGLPGNYEYWLSQTIAKTKSDFKNKDSLVFINAWNEWAEGCHLEPDRKYGHQFLEATLSAKSGSSTLNDFPSKWSSSNQNLVLNGITFNIDNLTYIDKFSQDNYFVLLKTNDMIERIKILTVSLKPQFIFELGIYKGGSCALYSELFQPEKLVAVDYFVEEVLPLTHYIASKNLQQRVKPYYHINQTDRLTLEKIYDSEFENQFLDLVIDDASHFYEETKASFNILFPKLRTGGIYIIEDWSWCHWQGEQWQKPQGYFKGKKPLSVLVTEIMMASASNSPQGFIKNITISYDMVFIERGAQPLSDTFDISKTYLTGEEPMGSFDPRYQREDFSALKENDLNKIKKFNPRRLFKIFKSILKQR